MRTGLQISASGILNAGRRQRVTANNIANLATPGYRAARAHSAPTPNGGVHVTAITRSEAPGVAAPAPPASHPDAGAPRGSNVDLATEQVGGLLNVRTAEANANAFRAQDEMLGELLDLSS